MEYIIGILFLAITFGLINKSKIFRTKAISRFWLNISFGAKILAGAAMIFNYSATEEIKKDADIFRFYDDAKVIYSAVENGEFYNYIRLLTGKNADDPSLAKYYFNINNFEHQDPGNLTNNKFFIRYVAFLCLFTFGSYAGILVINLFITFLGLFWIYKFFYSKLENLKWFLFAIIFFTPSIIYWTSGLLKESLIIFSISLILNCGNYVIEKKRSFLRIIIIILALFVLFQVKTFVLLVIIPPMLAYLWLHFFPSQRTMIPYFMMIFIAFSFATESDKYLETGVFETLIDKQMQFVDLAITEGAGSNISPIMFQPTALSVASNSPIAIINVLFRPMIWEADSMIKILAAIENTFFLILLLILIIFPLKSVENPAVLWFSLVFAISFFVVIGLATPVLGAISRYRVPALIFYLIGIIQLLDINQIKNKLKFIKK